MKKIIAIFTIILISLSCSKELIQPDNNENLAISLSNKALISSIDDSAALSKLKISKIRVDTSSNVTIIDNEITFDSCTGDDVTLSGETINNVRNIFVNDTILYSYDTVSYKNTTGIGQPSGMKYKLTGTDINYEKVILNGTITGKILEQKNRTITTLLSQNGTNQFYTFFLHVDVAKNIDSTSTSMGCK